MADEDAEKRLHSVMDKLFRSPKSNLLNRSAKSSMGMKRGNSATTTNNELMMIAELSRGSKRSTTVGTGSSLSEIPLCKPWDRGDLIRRLGTFKSMTWFAKPKVVSAVNCARRGWINVEVDIIACEACGARLLFCTPSSWTQHQIEKAAAVFSLKLNDGHRMLCPWIDNACDETLAKFPPTPAPALVDSYSKRSSALLQLSALPAISSSTIDRMKSPQIKHFLEYSSLLGFDRGTVQTIRVDQLGNEHEAVSANLYYQAQKLISLCGWEPRLLPYMVDCRNPPNLSTDDAHSKDRYPPVNGQNAAIIMHSTSDADDATKVNDDHSHRLQIYDPSSVVLDCKLCGACVGLWAFSTVPRPLELIRLIESSEGDNETNVSNSDGNIIDGITRASGTDCLVNENHFGHGGGCVSPGISTKKRHLDLSLSIAGGPPVAKQNYRARVSLPIISRYLRTGISSNFSVRDNNMHNDSAPLSDLSNANSFQQKSDCSTRSPQNIQSEAIGIEKGNEIESFTPRNEGQSCLNGESNEENVLKSSKENVTVPSEGRSSSELEVPPELVVDTTCDSSNENQTRCTNDITEVSGTNNNTDEYAGSIGEAKVGVDMSFQVIDVLATGPDANGRVGDGLSNQDNSMMIMTKVCPQQLDKGILGHDMIHEDTSEARDHVSSNVTSLNMTKSVETTSKMDLVNADKCNDFRKFSNDQGTQQAVNRVTPTVQPAINSEFATAQGLGNDLQVMQPDQVMAFDPIAQHRHFCPWIESNGGAACGWQLTLSALDRERDSSHHLPRESPASSFLEVDDPIASVRDLFTSPPSKRKKTSSALT